MKYCTRCVYPLVAVNLYIDEEGVCSACRVAEQFSQLTEEFWKIRKQKFEQIIEETKKNSQIMTVLFSQWGKDSYFQTHMIVKNMD